MGTENTSIMKITENPRQSQVLLFGCGDLGEYAKLVMDYRKIEVMGYMSNHVPEEGTYMGLPVYVPEEAARLYPDAYIAICVFGDETEQTIRGQLTQIGFKKFIDKESVISEYFLCNLKPMLAKIHDNGEIVFEKITLCVTERCSLKCKYCGVFFPYIEAPINYPLEQIIHEMQRVAKAVRMIREISLIGGEPFMHPQIAEICEELARIQNIQKIVITSNGTIVPNDYFFERFKKYQSKIQLLITDYGTSNYALSRLGKKCQEFGVELQMYKPREDSGREWEVSHVPENFNRSWKENRNLYMTCKTTGFCNGIRNGRLYKCMTASIGERLGRIPFDEKDSINLLDMNETIEDLRERIRAWLLSEQPMMACGYCYSGKLKEIPMGEQIKEEGWNIEKLKKEVNI